MDQKAKDEKTLQSHSAVGKYMSTSDGDPIAEPSPLSSITSKNLASLKKNTRHRLTEAEKQIFTKQCVERYQQGRSTKLIAYDLNVREDEVKRVLWDYVQTSQHPVVHPKIFLGTPTTRLKDIGENNNASNFYEVHIQLDGTLVCKPLSNLSSCNSV